MHQFLSIFANAVICEDENAKLLTQTRLSGRTSKMRKFISIKLMHLIENADIREDANAPKCIYFRNETKRFIAKNIYLFGFSNFMQKS